MTPLHIRDIAVSPLKGGCHVSRERIELTGNGPVGDRIFAVVDLAAGRVLKTVEHPALVACEAHWQGGTLSVRIDGRQITARPETDATRLALDYWGRSVTMRVVAGPWAAEFSRLLGRPVALARVGAGSDGAASDGAAGGVVYGESVTLTTTGSLERLARAAGHAVDSRRFRSTFLIDTGDAGAHVEDSWVGRELVVGGVRLRVGAGIPRCAVIDLDPETGARGTNLLTTLGGYRLDAGEISFGVYATVVRAGFVSRGDEVRLAPRPEGS